MSDNLTPPSLPPLITIDPAEFIALRAIVMALVGAVAAQNEGLGGAPAQTWINNVAIRCTDAIRTAKIKMSDLDAEGLRRKTLDHVNSILGGVRFPSDSRSN
jgi:hypothetical protein